MSRPAAQQVFGVHAVHAVLHNQPTAVRELRLAAGSGNPRLLRLRKAAQAAGIPVLEVQREALDLWAGAVRHQGVMAILGEEGGAVPQSLEGLLEGLTEAPLLLVLDGIQDPHNLGACLRSAAAAGVHGVIAPKDRAVGLTPVVRKVACGAAEQLPFIQVTNLARSLRRLQELGLWIAGADSEAPQSLYEADLSGPLALVMGAEGKGLRRLTRECCDLLVAIPMAGAMESLNVSVATGICLFEVRRQRAVIEN